MSALAKRHEVEDEERSCADGVNCSNRVCAAWHRDEACLREIGAALEKAGLRPAARTQAE